MNQTKPRSGWLYGLFKTNWNTVHSLGSLKFTFALNQTILLLMNNTNDDTWWSFYEYDRTKSIIHYC